MTKKLKTMCKRAALAALMALAITAPYSANAAPAGDFAAGAIAQTVSAAVE
jgi:hypothetical protein